MSKQLTLKQQSFIDNYTDPENGITYGNATQSYLKAHSGITYDTAKQEGHRNLTKPYIKNEIERIIDEIGLGSKVRMQAINSIITNNHHTTTTTTTHDKDGNEYTSTTVKTPTARELITAVDLVERITGTYDKNKVKADVMSSELKQLIKSHRKELDG